MTLTLCTRLYKAGGNKGTRLTQVRWDMAEFSDESTFQDISRQLWHRFRSAAGAVHVIT